MPPKKRKADSSSHEPLQKAPTLVATIIKTISGVNGRIDITLSKDLESLTEAELVDAANTAISRLQPEQGPTGLVIVTSFSHTAIDADIQGATTDDTLTQRLGVIETLATGNPVNSEPESVDASLKKVACFALPPDLNLHKLNIAGIGAKSFVAPVYIEQIVQIIQQQQQQQQHVLASNNAPEIIANKIINDIVDNLHPRFIEEATKVFKPYTDYRFDAIRKLIESELKKASKRNHAVLTFQHLSKAAQKSIVGKTPYTPLVNAVAYQFHYDNLQAGAAFTHSTQRGSCMMNKEYMRQDKVEEHQPPVAWDWRITLFGKNGAILLGNTSSTTDPSWRMDLITLVKILKQTDKVTTKDILDLLYANDIKNIVFIDGGCNVFCSYDRTQMLACSGCHSSLDTVCSECNIRVGDHHWGGMKNKKIKKTKTTKKKATVRGRRMRKSYKRYKRSKTYKR